VVNFPEQAPGYGPDLPIKIKSSLLVLRLALGAIKGFAEEREGIVIMKRDSAPRSSGSITTSVFIDTDGNKIPDTVLYIHNPNKVVNMMLLNEYIQKNSTVLFDDRATAPANGLSGMETDGLISIDGLSVLDMFPEAPDTWFPYAL
jgi:hypothetical protein